MKTKVKEENHAIANAEGWMQSIRDMIDRGEKGTEEQAEAVREEIQECPLSVEVRSDWYTLTPGADMKPYEYRITLTWGGPALQITGTLDQYQHPETVRLEYQDWGTPWTEYVSGDFNEYKKNQAYLLKFASCFYFGE